jgi:hypothetical protein
MPWPISALPNDFEIVGTRQPRSGVPRALNRQLGGGIAEFSDYAQALATTKPDAVCISTYPDTHAAYAIAAMEAGAHVFLENRSPKRSRNASAWSPPLTDCGASWSSATSSQVHPSWLRFVELAQTLGKPLVMRMNLNQQSSGANWRTHRNLLSSLSPIGRLRGALHRGDVPHDEAPGPFG